MKEIKATEGMYLTQSAEVGDNRIYVSAIKGANVNASDWREATKEEKEAFEKAQMDKQENLMDYVNEEN